MNTIIFLYKGKPTEIQCKKEKMKVIFKKIMDKYKIDINSVYFSYLGKEINEELTFEKLANEKDKTTKKMIIRINDKNFTKSTKKSENIICPICYDNINIEIEDYNIFLYDCRNKHIIDNLFIDEFEKTQHFDESEIKCEICKEINITDQCSFYRCGECKKNICGYCKSNHDQNHNIIFYIDKDNICDKHKLLYMYYCTKCKMNMCIKCNDDHKYHVVKCFGHMISHIPRYELKLSEIKENISKFDGIVNEIKTVLDCIKNFYTYFYNVGQRLFNNYNIETINYEKLHNIEEMCDNDIFKDLNYLINEIDIKDKLIKICDIYHKISTKHINKFKINYKINENQKK